MSEEKNLNDETVKDVAGGNVQRAPLTPDYKFFMRNCDVCRFGPRELYGDQSCPYKNPSDAFMQLNGADCPSKRYR